MQISKPQTETLSTKTALFFLIPLVVVVGLLLLFIFVIPASFSEITNRIENYEKDKEKAEILTKKLAVLRTTSADTLDKSPQSVMALPDKNSVLSLISQIKEIAITQNASVTDIKTGSITEVEGNIKKIEFTIGIEAADFTTLAKIIDEVTKHAPISSFESTEISDQLTVKKATMKVFGYWSPLPDTLPEIHEPLEPFTQDELALLNNLVQLFPPQVNVLSPDNPAPRENPFN